MRSEHLWAVRAPLGGQGTNDAAKSLPQCGHHHSLDCMHTVLRLVKDY